MDGQELFEFEMICKVPIKAEGIAEAIKLFHEKYPEYRENDIMHIIHKKTVYAICN